MGAQPSRPPVWFEYVTGVEESAWLKTDRGHALLLGEPIDGNPRFGPHLSLRRKADGVSWDAGAFSVWSIAELLEATRPVSTRLPGLISNVVHASSPPR